MAFWTRRNWMTLAAVNGFAAIAVGAFAAHAVSDPKAQELLRVGSTYGFMHTMATLACATFIQVGARRARLAPAFFLSGVALFSGSLYAMALGAPRWIGMVTPVGGLLFLTGWAVLAWAARGVDPLPSAAKLAEASPTSLSVLNETPAVAALSRQSASP